MGTSQYRVANQSLKTDLWKTPGNEHRSCKPSFIYTHLLPQTDFHFYLPFPSNLWISLSVYGVWVTDLRTLLDLSVWGIYAVYVGMNAVEVKCSYIQEVSQRGIKGGGKGVVTCMLAVYFSLLTGKHSFWFGSSGMFALWPRPSHMTSWACLLICKMGLIPCRVIARIKWQTVHENICQFLAAYLVLNKYWSHPLWSSKAEFVRVVHSTEGNQKAYIKFHFFHWNVSMLVPVLYLCKENKLKRFMQILLREKKNQNCRQDSQRRWFPLDLKPDFLSTFSDFF